MLNTISQEFASLGGSLGREINHWERRYNPHTCNTFFSQPRDKGKAKLVPYSPNLYGRQREHLRNRATEPEVSPGTVSLS